MALFRFVAVCVVVCAGHALEQAATTTLVQVPLTPSTLKVIAQVLPDGGSIEELTHTYAKIWADDAQIRSLKSKGFEVQTEGVEHTSKMNADRALDQKSNIGIEKQQEPNWSQFITYDEMVTLMQTLASQCPQYSLGSIGQSVQGRQILVMEITGNNGPEVLMAGGIHGDETVGGQLLLRLLYDMCHKTNSNPGFAQILSSIHLFVMPQFNPDGYVLRRRGNAQGVDLNRDFPNNFTSPYDSFWYRATETQHMMEFTASRNFKLSLMFHGGALVANYAYDSVPFGTPSGTYAPTDRDALVRQLALTYSTNHTTMSTGGSTFPQGIVNGAQWYVIYGSFQDFMYDYRGCIDLTLEVSNVKWPSGSQLPSFYTANLQAMISYILAGQIV